MISHSLFSYKNRTQKQYWWLFLTLLLVLLLIISGCSPDLHSENPKERMRAVQALSADEQEVLEKIAFTDNHNLVRLFAVEKIINPVALQKIALQDSNSTVRYSAVEKITDQIVLQKIATQDKYNKNRILAITKITDQSVLLQIAGQDKNRSVRRAATERLTLPLKTNQQILIKIASREKNKSILIAVIERLNDLPTLVNIVNTNSNYILAAAKKRISNKDIKVSLSLKGKINFNHRYLIEKIVDKNELLKIALADTLFSAHLQIVAIRNISDKTMLAKIAKKTKRSKVRDFVNAKLIVEPITNQIKLGKIALHGKNNTIRGYAIEKITDNILLRKIALKSKLNKFLLRCKAIENITDKTMLYNIVTSQQSNRLRHCAVSTITEVDELKKIVAENKNSNLQSRAKSRISTLGELEFKKITDQEILEKAAVQRYNSYQVIAIKKLLNTKLLYRLALKNRNINTRELAKLRIVELAKIQGISSLAAIAVGATDITDFEIRNIALLDLMHEDLLTALAFFEKNQKVRIMAINLLENQKTLQKIAGYDSAAHARKAAIIAISDDNFLLQRINKDTSKSVRFAAVQTLHNKQTFLKAIQQGYYYDVRAAAYSRLVDTGDRKLINRAKLLGRKFNKRINKLLASSDSELLINEALQGQIDVMREVSASRLKKISDLKQVAIMSVDRDVLIILLSKIEDKKTLNEIATTAASEALRLAAAYKSGKKTWSEIFETATNSSDSSEKTLGNALAAVIFFKKIQTKAKASVQQASLKLIRIGDESRIPEMVELLNLYGNTLLAEDYLNCGQPDLNSAAIDWANEHGYNIRSGGGSNRARWGSH